MQRWPEDPLMWTALGNVHYLQQDFSAAEQAYVQALNRAPDHWPARNNLVQAIMAQGCVGRGRPWLAHAGDPPAEFAPTWTRTLEEFNALPTNTCDVPQDVRRL